MLSQEDDDKTSSRGAGSTAVKKSFLEVVAGKYDGYVEAFPGIRLEKITDKCGFAWL
jgi:hypothetical protein